MRSTLLPKQVVLTSLLLVSVFSALSQEPYTPEMAIKYDTLKNVPDKPIPFDRPFTLFVDKKWANLVTEVYAFEAETKLGRRALKENSYIDCNGDKDWGAIADIKFVNFYLSDSALKLYFPALRPNRQFDINIVSKLSPTKREMLMKINRLIKKRDLKQAKLDFRDFDDALADKINNRTYLNIDSDEYLNFYQNVLSVYYDQLSDYQIYKSNGKLSIAQIKAIDIATSQYVSDYKDAYYLIEVDKNKLLKDLQLGLLAISKIYKSQNRAELIDGVTRIANLNSNKAHFDSLQTRIERVTSKDKRFFRVAGQTVDMDTISARISEIRANLSANLKIVSDLMKNIDDKTDANDNIREGTYLSLGNLSPDLKTAGGQVLFLDVGLANLVVPNVRGDLINIPKLYWGVSIYFRPIDKNTRTNTFSRKAKGGCVTDSLTGIRDMAPDGNIVATPSFWQHFCLNIGFTVGAMKNSEFDNLYNGMSLLAGPAYRFARAFKASAGFSLTRRSSVNPVISEKQIQPGGYISASVDIDFVETLKDIKTMLFK